MCQVEARAYIHEMHLFDTTVWQLLGSGSEASNEPIAVTGVVNLIAGLGQVDTFEDQQAKNAS